MGTSEHGPAYWNRIVERTLNEQSPYARDHIYIGDHYHRKTPLLSPLSMWTRHAIVYGAPGSGKSVLLNQIATQLIAMGYDINLVKLDCKGSKASINNFLLETDRARDLRTGEPIHQVRVFNPLPGMPSHIYNPYQQRAWKEAPAHTRARAQNDAFGIRGAEGTDTAFFASQSFLIGTLFQKWFPQVSNATELLSLLDDRHLFAAKGGNPPDWNHSRQQAANLLLLASSPALNAIPVSRDQEIQLSDLFEGPKPCVFYFYLSMQDPGLSAMVGRFVLEQIEKTATLCDSRNSKRWTFILADEAQSLYGPLFLDCLEKLREYRVSLISFNQSRGQLVTGAGDFRDRFDNGVGLQICLGARTPEDITYLQETDREELEYHLSWQQQPLQANGRALLHPSHSYRPGPMSPPLINVSESRCPRLSRAEILKVSSDPQAGFFRGFQNDGLWAHDGSWVPFRWFHHLTRQQHQEIGKHYPAQLPGQVIRDIANAPAEPRRPFDPAGPVTSTGTKDLETALNRLLQQHRQQAST